MRRARLLLLCSALTGSAVIRGGEPPAADTAATRATIKRRAVEPSAEEQTFIYLLNKARNDPAAYGESIGVDLSDAEPAPPLVPSKELTAAARFRASDMAGRRYFGHVDPDGIGPNRHALESGYELAAIYSRDDRANNIEAISAGAAHPAGALAQLITDRTTPTLAHRKQLLAMDDFFALARDVGVGMVRARTGDRFGAYWAVHMARKDQEQLQVTGVAYQDRNSNGVYDAGEGIARAVVSCDEATAETMQQGGFALPVRPGQVRVRCRRPGARIDATADIWVNDRDIHLEFVSGQSRGIVGFGSAQPAGR